MPYPPDPLKMSLAVILPSHVAVSYFFGGLVCFFFGKIDDLPRTVLRFEIFGLVAPSHIAVLVFFWD